MPTRRRLYRSTLYSLAIFFPFWLYFLSDIFMWTYTPVPRKLAVTAVALILPILLFRERNIPARLFAIILFIITVLPLLAIWLEPVPEWIKYA